LKGLWVPHDLRDQICDFLRHYAALTELAAARLLGWMELSPRKYQRWRKRYGKANEHNGLVPRDNWLEPKEREAIIGFAREYPLEGYRRFTFNMLDSHLVSVSPTSTYRVLKDAGLLQNWNARPTNKGSGFVQPLEPHEHWHVDFSYLNIAGTFYYLCSVLDGCSRMILSWDIRPTMKEADAEIVLQKAYEGYPGFHPRVITDNGSQFVARDFKAFLRHFQTTHVFTAPHYPQSNGKIERFHRTLKEQAIRPRTPLSLEDAKRVAGAFIDHYNQTRLHSALGYIAPADRLAGRHRGIFAQRDQKLENARHQRKLKRQQLAAAVA
jgi:transposase InsO family protein